MTASIPLFPLKATLFPSGRIPLQIFEPRYLEMVSYCMRLKVNFGVVTIVEGQEVGEIPQICPIGTEAIITDFQQLKNGMLGLLVEGGRKFTIHSQSSSPNRRLLAEVEWLPPEPLITLPGDQFEGLRETLQQLLDYPFIKRLSLAADLDDARKLGWQLAQLLPLPPIEKQKLLILDDPIERLIKLEGIFDALGQESE